MNLGNTIAKLRKNNNLTHEKIGIDSAIKVEQKLNDFDLFPEQDNIFPTLMDNKE